MKTRWAIEGVLAMRAAARCVVGLALLVLAVPHAQSREPTWDAQRARRIDQQLAPVREAVVADYLKGDPARALSRLRGAVDETDWLALLMLGNYTWTLHPAESFQWHRRAYELSGGDSHALLELALEYTRHEQCDKAADAWQKIDQAKLLDRHLPMLAGYCYLQLGEDERAFAMFDRSRSRHGGLENLLEEVWGRPIALVAHADRLKAFNDTEDVHELDAALANADRFDIGPDRGQALLAIADAAARAPRSKLAAPLACLRPVFEKEASKADVSADVGGGHPGLNGLSDVRAEPNRRRDLWRTQLAACKLRVDADPLPESSVLFKFLVVNALNLEMASRQEILAAHRESLDRRARSVPGDLEALQVLAALQEKVEDPGLKETDTLGWERYGLAEFARSRIKGEFAQDTLSDEGKGLLKRAYSQFPHDSGILQLWLQHGNPDKDASRQGWRELTLLQFHTPSIETDEMHFSPVARTLYWAIHKYREAAE